MDITFERLHLQSNFSIYSISDEPAHQLFIRIISRTPMKPFYPNDWPSFKVLQSESASPIIPEELSHEIRPFFT